MLPYEYDKLVPSPYDHKHGIPTVYVPYENEGSFELFPIPDAIYTLISRYSLWPQDLANDTTESDYKYMDDVILAWATMYGWLHFQEYEDSAIWNNIGIKDYQAARKAERQRTPDWAPKGRGFNTFASPTISDPVNNPLITKYNY